jgi:peptidoglycan/xylan/chitin deacetylase (PgdA/CDA1 family)
LYWYDELRRRLAVWNDATVRIPDTGEARRWPADDPSRRVIAREIEEACKRVSNAARVEYLDDLRRRTPGWSVDGEELDLIEPMTWDDVRALSDQGFEIGSHTVEHPILSRLPPEALRDELRLSKQRLEEATGKPCFAISYPNGSMRDVTPGVVAETEAAGYDLGFMMTERLQRQTGNRFQIARVSAPGHAPLGALRMRTSGLHSLLSGSGRRRQT